MGTAKEASKAPKEEPTPLQVLEQSDGIDMPTFEQVLEMDDDEVERDFSKSIVYDFFTQADTTFEKMDTSLQERDLPALSSLGHFLKGSSATLGLNRVRDSCEKIQNLGAGKVEDGSSEMDDKQKSLDLIQECISEARTDFRDIERHLREFYGE